MTVNTAKGEASLTRILSTLSLRSSTLVSLRLTVTVVAGELPSLTLTVIWCAFASASKSFVSAARPADVSVIAPVAGSIA